jgi:hypothetical protein
VACVAVIAVLAIVSYIKTVRAIFQVCHLFVLELQQFGHCAVLKKFMTVTSENIVIYLMFLPVSRILQYSLLHCNALENPSSPLPIQV